MFITVLAWVGGMTFVVLSATGLWVLIGLVSAILKSLNEEG